MPNSVVLDRIHLLGDIGIPQTYYPVHAPSDDDILVLREVEALDPLVDIEHFLVSIQPHSGVCFLALFRVRVTSLIYSSAPRCTSCWREDTLRELQSLAMVYNRINVHVFYLACSIFDRCLNFLSFTISLSSVFCVPETRWYFYLPITNAVSWWFEQEITCPISW